MRSTTRNFRPPYVALKVTLFFFVLAYAGECFAQRQIRGRCALNSTARISNEEVNDTVTCIRNDLQGIRLRIQVLKELIDTLKNVVAYGEIAEDGSAQFVRPPPCEKLNLNVASERPGLFRISFDHPLKVKPMIFITLMEGTANSGENHKNGWVAGATESGFLVKTSPDGKILGNVAFNVLILVGDVGADQCSVK